jgi:hypothetical protein
MSKKKCERAMKWKEILILSNLIMKGMELCGELISLQGAE